MKMKGILLFLSMVFVSVTAWGVPITEKTTSSNNENKMEITATSSKALTKAEVRIQKKIERKQRMFKKVIVKKMEKYGDVDFQDPVQKWMWFWIFGWGAGLLLWILSWTVLSGGSLGGFGILGLLGSLAWLFGTVALVVWLVKMAS